MRYLTRLIISTIVTAAMAVSLTAAPAAADWTPAQQPVKIQLARSHRGFRATRATAASSAHSQSGKASYYSNGAYGGSGHCAHKTLPKGTAVAVHGPRGTITCIVTDRGPYVAGRIIDLNPGDFAVIAGGTGAGVVSVVITW